MSAPAAAPPRASDPEAVEALHAYTAAVQRVAQLRKLDAELPGEIAKWEQRVRDLAQALGLPSSRVVRERRAAKGERAVQLRSVMPGRTADLAVRSGLSQRTVLSHLHNMRRRGEAVRDETTGVWSVPEGSEA